MKKSTFFFYLITGISTTLCVNVYASEKHQKLAQNKSTQENLAQMKSSTENPNLSAGEKFLMENQKAEGVTTTSSGLQYKVLTEGHGEKPKKNDMVTVHYAGKLINGKEFDSSYKRNEPATFPVSGVIPGWTEALQLMKVGSTWELFIPAKLAYGEHGAPPVIGPNEVLIFKVELLGIKK